MLESLIYDLQLFGDAYLELDALKMKQPTPMELIGRMEANWCQYGTFPLNDDSCSGNRRPKPPKMRMFRRLMEGTTIFSRQGSPCFQV